MKTNYAYDEIVETFNTYADIENFMESEQVGVANRECTGISKSILSDDPAMIGSLFLNELHNESLLSQGKKWRQQK